MCILSTSATVLRSCPDPVRAEPGAWRRSRSLLMVRIATVKRPFWPRQHRRLLPYVDVRSPLIC